MFDAFKDEETGYVENDTGGSIKFACRDVLMPIRFWLKVGAVSLMSNWLVGYLFLLFR